jgi:hypothetical protein
VSQPKNDHCTEREREREHYNAVKASMSNSKIIKDSTRTFSFEVLNIKDIYVNRKILQPKQTGTYDYATCRFLK